MNRKEMYLYVSYVITLDTQQSFVEWIEEKLIGIRIIEGITKEMVTI